MPLGNLQTTTWVGTKAIDGDNISAEYYSVNQQLEEKAPAEPQPTLGGSKYQERRKIAKKAPKGNPKKPARGSYKTSADAVLKENDKDLAKRNLK